MQMVANTEDRSPWNWTTFWPTFWSTRSRPKANAGTTMKKKTKNGMTTMDQNHAPPRRLWPVWRQSCLPSREGKEVRVEEKVGTEEKVNSKATAITVAPGDTD